jgi:hypothetical protein
MGAVSNITEFSNSITIGNALSAIMSPALVKATCMMNLMTTEGLPQGSTALAPDSNGELTDSSITATIAKIAVVSGVSVEEQAFGNISLDRIAAEQGNAIARYVDNDALSLFSGFATAVTSASLMTIDDIMLGQYNIFNSECPNKEVPLACVLHPRAYYAVKKEIIQSGASAWSNQNYLEILNGTPQSNCFVGSIPGLAQFYTTTGAGTSGGDTYSAIFHPMWALAGAFAPAPVTWFKDKGAEGFYTEVASYYFYDVIEWNDLCGVGLLSDT